MDDEREGGPLLREFAGTAGAHLEETYCLLVQACQQHLQRLHQHHQRLAGHVVLLLAAAASERCSQPMSLVTKAAGLTLEEAVRELGPAVAALEQPVAGVLGSEPPLGRRIHLREIQQAFVFYRVLGKKTRDLHSEYFALPQPGRPAPAAEAAAPAAAAAAAAGEEQREAAQSLLDFFWLLFCTARSALLPPHADLVTSFALLLSCTHFMLTHVPAQHHRTASTAAADSRAGGSSEGSGEGGSGEGASTDDLLVAVAASHSAGEHIATVRQLSYLLHQLAADTLSHAVGAQQAPPGQQQQVLPGEQQQQQQQQQQPEDAAEAPIQALFNAAGQPHPAAVAALWQRYQQAAGSADLDPLSCLGCLSLGRQAAAKASSAGAPTQRAQHAPASAAAPMETDLPAAATPASSKAAREAAEPAGPEQEQGEGTAAAAAAAGAAADGAFGSPARQWHEGSKQADTCTPKKARLQAAGSPDVPQLGAAEGQGAAGAGGGQRDAAFKTPSPVKRRAVPPLVPPATPISAAMGSTAWLRVVVAAQEEGPSAALQSQMRAARLTGAAQAQMVERVQQMAASVFADAPAQMEGQLRALEQSTIEARRSEGVRLYWLSLESLVTAEGAHAGSSPGGAASLLSAPLFHRCVAACAFETVISAYRMGALEFPAVLDRLQLPAFDLCKLIEPFVQQLPTLPKDLKRHMLSVEERCLESLAWQRGSSLYTALMAAVGTLLESSPPAAQQQQQHEWQAEVSRPGSGQSTASGGSMTPRKRGRGEMTAEGGADVGADTEMAEAAQAVPVQGQHAQQQGQQEQQGQQQQQQQVQQGQQQQGLQGQQQGASIPQGCLPLSLASETADCGATAAGSGEGSGGGGSDGGAQAMWAHHSLAGMGDRSSRAAVSEFLRRVLKLTAIRLADLLSRMDPPPQEPQLLLAEAYTLAQHVAFEHTWLLYGRHVDQTMLCCLYAAAKVRAQEELSLKAIIRAYTHQPQARTETFKSVSLTPRERTSLSLEATERGDIILFYNKLFIPHIRPFLQRLHDSRGLLAQPPSCALPYLNQHAQGLAGVIPPPPSLLIQGIAQTPCVPGLAATWASTRGLVGTPRAPTPSAGGMQLLSPGTWRINRGNMTPLASPRLDQLSALTVNSSSPLPARPLSPLSMAAIHHMFGIQAAAGDSTAAEAAAAAAEAAALPPLPAVAAATPKALAVGPPADAPVPTAAAPAPAAAPAAPSVNPPAPPADVLELFAVAEAAAEAEAAAAMALASGPRDRHRRQQQQREHALRAEAEAEDEGMHDLSSLPAQSLPLLAAAAVVAEEIERTENEVAAAFAGLRPSSGSNLAQQYHQQHYQAQQQYQQGDWRGSGFQQPHGKPRRTTAAAAASEQQQQQPAALAPGAQLPAQQAQAVPLPSPRHARRILNMQPAPSPVQ